ncbi:hypothetical protein Desor_1160 [Desulfosporosinus orientis DSM 765]|uniref:Uncharacterized protein n=1 Tax=Desulfosporosinus orientis (strain ATCC 19365 / DSM 765 / NCIMB 8382 / VKM B-1628 / Singapore I) TaxID=768706 RepID=G7WCS1_DESOD|nr:hypothetical protein [Desulfosporosinus orientis]AET66827.1 hypothetical protein Desor_1160 [Desulfosporosinus orientis DSM 765]
MVFPYGEWVIISLTLLTWSEKQASRRFFLMLTAAWLVGKGLEILMGTALPWNWHFARLSVMLVFWVWALKRAEHRVFPFLLTSLIFSAETLFLVNEPGVFPYGSWFFALGKLLAAWLSARTYWGTAAALTGSALFNQLFLRFTYDGIISYMDLPNDFTWNVGIGLLSLWAGLSLGWSLYCERKRAEIYEAPEERDLP